MNLNDFDLKRLPRNDYVDYFLYKDDDAYLLKLSFKHDLVDNKDTNVSNCRKLAGFKFTDSRACFARLPDELRHGKDFNRIIFFPDVPKTLSPVEIDTWLKLSKKYNLLPKYFDSKLFLQKHAAVFDTRAHDKKLLFVYLCMIRFLASEPVMVKNVITMCVKYQHNFYAALVLFSKTSVESMLHHFLPDATIYPKPKALDNSFTFNLASVIGLYRFLDAKGCVEMDGRYNVNHTIRNLCNKTWNIKLSEILPNNYIARLYRKSDAVIEKLYKEYITLK